nr:hypothetical protein JG3_0180 [uncultured bacterium]
MHSDVCPSCAGVPGKFKPRIEVLRFSWMMFIFNDEPGREWVREAMLAAPAYCDACASKLKKAQTISSLLSIAPVIAILALNDITKSFFGFFFFMTYSLFHLLLRGNYTWSDYLLYGAQLSDELKEFLPDTRGKKVFYPVPWLQVWIRLGLYFGGGFAVLIVKELLR